MPPKADETRRGRVLVVDDQEHLCWVLSKLLSERGHEVRTAQTRTSALKAVHAGFECQVALVDYRLPTSNGLALIAELTSHLPRLRAILMTSYGSASLRQRASDAHVFAYVDKPFTNDLLMRTVEHAICAWETGADSLM